MIAIFGRTIEMKTQLYPAEETFCTSSVSFVLTFCDSRSFCFSTVSLSSSPLRQSFDHALRSSVGKAHDLYIIGRSTFKFCQKSKLLCECIDDG